MEAFVDLSLRVDDSNAIVLPGKKKNKIKKDKGKFKAKFELSKSQKRKLKKLQDDKEKERLLFESTETLKKYDIGEDAYSLMWSSRNLGQVETFREKRRRGVQFSKAGLCFPDNDRPNKRKASDSTHENQSDLYTIPLRQMGNESDSSSPAIGEREVLHNTSVYDSSAGVVHGHKTSSLVGEPSDGHNNEASMLGDLQNSLLISSSNVTDVKNSTATLNEYPKGNLSSLDNQANGSLHRDLIAPLVVHVSRPKELEHKRKDLPIVMMEQEIMEAINYNVGVIICGETGCGKTTQVPQFLFEAGFGSSQHPVYSGMIGVTQPRRVAVLATAKRVSFELGLRLGKEVGFQVRYDKRIGDNCSIKFMTDGILLRELQNDFLLKRYSIIILDEAHERSLNTDILIGMLSRIIQERQKIYDEQTNHAIHSGTKISPENRIFPLKLVLMSATMRVEDFVSGRRIFCEPPPVIEVPTRQYPVTVHFSKRTEMVDYVGQAYKKVLSIHKKLPSGGILIFVTGQREVEYLCQKLRKASKEMVSSSLRRRSVKPSVSEGNSIEDHDIDEINEAFDIQGNSSIQQTDRFSLYDGDLSECDSSLESDEGSDLDDSSEDEDLLDQNDLDPSGNFADVLKDDGNLTSLKVAFEALAGKGKLKTEAEGKEAPSVTPGGSSQSNTSLVEKMGEPDPVSSMCVLPLYAMLPASAQLRVFDEVKKGERLIVVATNVAETSLTIPGIKYVVDTGREKVKVYNSSNGMETYEVQWISKASASQRAGRAGRTGPGHCYRLYSSAVFSNIFPDFSSAEISKIPVDGVVLLMKSMGIDKVVNFPFPTPPDGTALLEAERCLKVLEALDINGRLTFLGKAMALYPMSPRHSRMLLTAIQILKKDKSYSRPNLVLGYTLAAAAALSLANPFITQFEENHVETNGLKHDEKDSAADCNKVLEKEEKLRKKKLKETTKVLRAKFLNPASDTLSIAYALQCFEQSKSPVEFCTDNGLYLKTMEEMSKLRKQLLKLVFTHSLSNFQQDFIWTHGTMEDVECAWRVFSDKQRLLSNEEQLLRQAICAGWADRVAKRIKRYSGMFDGDRKVNAVRYQACMVKETVFLHRRSAISKFAPDYMVYSELLHTKRPYIHGATSVEPEWLVRYAGSLCTFSAPHTDRTPFYKPLSDQVCCWVTPTFGPHLWQLEPQSFPIKDDMLRVTGFAYVLLKGTVLPCLKSVQEFLAAEPSIILRPESTGHKRVGNLLCKLKTKSRTIDSCATLRETWNKNPSELYSEIRDWFREGFHHRFEELWAGMHREVLLGPELRYAKKSKTKKIPR